MRLNPTSPIMLPPGGGGSPGNPSPGDDECCLDGGCSSSSSSVNIIAKGVVYTCVAIDGVEELRLSDDGETIHTGIWNVSQGGLGIQGCYGVLFQVNQKMNNGDTNIAYPLIYGGFDQIMYLGGGSGYKMISDNNETTGPYAYGDEVVSRIMSGDGLGIRLRTTIGERSVTVEGYKIDKNEYPVRLISETIYMNEGQVFDDGTYYIHTLTPKPSRQHGLCDLYGLPREWSEIEQGYICNYGLRDHCYPHCNEKGWSCCGENTTENIIYP